MIKLPHGFPRTQTFLRPLKTKTKQTRFPNRTNNHSPKSHFLDHPHQPSHPTHPGPQNEHVTFVSITQMLTFVSFKHERRDGLMERRATQRVALRSVIAPSIWPYHRSQNHLNYENLGFSQIVTRLCYTVDGKRIRALKMFVWAGNRAGASSCSVNRS
jgi:hypothetical protein